MHGASVQQGVVLALGQGVGHVRHQSTKVIGVVGTQQLLDTRCKGTRHKNNKNFASRRNAVLAQVTMFIMICIFSSSMVYRK